MKTSLNTLMMALLGSGLMLAPAAQADLSGNLGVTSNYLWRGVSQSDDAPAISGGLDYAHDSGFYAGTWTSNVDFGDDTSYEVDLYGGYAGEVGDLGYELGYIHYFYPNAAFEGEDYDADFGEINLALYWNWLGISAAYGLNTGDEAELYDKALYLEATASFELSESLGLQLAVGQQSFDMDGAEDYLNYSVSLTKSTDLGDVSFMVSDTDLDDDDPMVSVSWVYGFSL
ncbi:TorF family putative porin [Ferrimonas futtsuensis]|uniref:TorF family putative porin n=1 Tax=Ferrimonas futtsuensis TaxID=364764 RepID=UPI0004085B75|nr:TorF family putative porin [Ferrimonas futtsuensis]